MAEAVSARFLATAHQGDDLLETMLMRLMRGAGPQGLAGIRPKRPLAGSHVLLIRPMLGVTHADAERLCTLAGFEWRHDHTNFDVSRVRAAVRAHILPQLRQLSPRVTEHASVSSQLLAEAADLIHQQASELLAESNSENPGAITWARDVLRPYPTIVLGKTLRLAAARLSQGRDLDRLSSRVIRPVLGAITDGVTDPRAFGWSGLRVHVTAHNVTVERA